jgi:hypothetical protein
MPKSTTKGKKAFRKLNRVEQVIRGEGETATFLSCYLLNSSGLGGGFAPRQFGR